MTDIETKRREAADKAEALRKEKAATAAAVKAKSNGKPVQLPPDDNGLSLAAAETALRSARETLASLVDKWGRADGAAAALAEEREKIAFSALGQNDKTAQHRLQAIHAEVATHASEVAALNSAIAHAKLPPG